MYFLGSVGLFYALQALLPLSTTVTIAIWASAAINIFYWFAGVILEDSFPTITGVQVPWVRWPIRAIVLALSLFVDRQDLRQGSPVRGGRGEPADPAGDPDQPAAAKVAQKAAAASGPEVRFTGSDKPAQAEIGMSLLALAERESQPIEAGCRMGVCGADPVAVLDGGDCLSPPDEDELNTLRRLGFADNTRMACAARIQSGPVKVSLTPEPGNPRRAG